MTVTITAVNDPPVARDGALVAQPGAAASGTLLAGDAEGETLTYTIVANGSQGSAVITSAVAGTYTYTAIPGAAGADYFTFKANDGQADSNVATVTVTIASPQTTYTLTMAVTPIGGGEIGVTPLLASYAAGTTVSLLATPASGFVFVEWSGAATSSVPGLTLTMNADQQVEAIFARENLVTTAPLDASGTATLAVEADNGEPAARVSITGGQAGQSVTVAVHEGDEAGMHGFAGFAGGLGISKSMVISSALPSGSFAAVVELYYTDAELGALEEAELRLFRFNSATSQWELAGTNDVGVSAPTGNVGDYGVDPANNRVWAVVDHFSQFAAGKADVAELDLNNLPGPIRCGACGTLSPAMLLCWLTALWFTRQGVKRSSGSDRQRR